jgi:hypothetical protein
MFRSFFGLVIVGLLLGAAPAVAQPPVTETELFDSIEVFPAGAAENPCPFELTLHHHGTFLTTTFFDSNGEPVRKLVRSAHFTETLSANGKELTALSPVAVHVDPTTNIAVATGNQRHFVVPGVGIVYAQAGRFVVDLNSGAILSVSGLDLPPGSELCAALAP